MLSIPYIELLEVSSSHMLHAGLIISLASIGTFMIFKGAEILGERGINNE